MNAELAYSYGACRAIVREHARNFGYGFLCLPAEQRQGMDAVYAVLRICDDVTDAVAQPSDVARAQLEAWQAALHAASQGQTGGHPILPAFHDTLHRFGLSMSHIDELILGTGSDIEPRTYQTFDDLYKYCYRVAGIVGLLTIRVLGCRDVAADQYAEWMGVGFQLTNIVRDVKEDGLRGRVYLPLNDLDVAGISCHELLEGLESGALRECLHAQATRAREYYDRAQPVLSFLPRAGRVSVDVMQRIYRGLLDKMIQQDFPVFHERCRLSGARKVQIVSRVLSEQYLLRHEPPQPTQVAATSRAQQEVSAS